MSNRLAAGLLIAIFLAVRCCAEVPQLSHIVLVVEENHSYSSVIGNSAMPYLNGLASQYGLATQYYANTHPSIGNYFMLTTGQIVTNDDAFSGTVDVDNMVRALLPAGKTWKAYLEGLPSAGYTGGDVPPYLKHHNPFSYLTDVVNSSQAMNMAPFTQFAADLASGQLPNFSFVVPNVNNDAHDGTLAAADAWLQQNIAPLFNDSRFKQSGLLLVVFDESFSSDTANGGGQVALVVAGGGVKPGYQSTTLYQHPSVLRTVLQALGVTRFPGAAGTAPGLGEFFADPSIAVYSPANGSTVASPVHFVAGSTSSVPVVDMQIYVDDVLAYDVGATAIDTNLALSTGPHSITVKAWKSFGGSFSTALSITVSPAANPAPTIQLTASPASVTAGQSATLSWSSTNATSVNIQPGIGTVTTSGSVTVTPAGTTTYTAAATGAGGTATAPATVIVKPAASSCTLSTVDPSLTVCWPANGATVASPVHFVAGSTSSVPVVDMQVYVDDLLAYDVGANAIDANLALSTGSHSITVKAWKSFGGAFSTALSITVGAATNLQSINHMIYMLQENRSFDSYFGQLNAYRAQQGLPQEVDGLPAGASNLNFSGTVAITSYHFNTVCHLDLSPAWNQSHLDFNRNDPTSSTGLNDGFAYTAGKYGRDNGYWDVEGVRAMGYYDWTDLPYYYFMATQFATSDRWFAPAPTRTAPNRYYAVSATSAGHAYPSNTALTNTTIFELLQQAGISWRVYVSAAGNSILYDFAFSSRFSDHFVPATQFAADAANGTLPAVALIEQAAGLDEHPGDNVQTGASSVSRLINSLMNSPSWKDSVFILTYDEGGAMYDHVPSPPARSPDGIKPVDLAPTDIPGDFTRYGFRVPVMVISPFTRPHYVSHTVADHTAILRLIETRFNLPSLTVRDGTSMDMTEFFDFVNVPWRTPPSPPAQPTSGNCYYDHLP